MAGAAKPAAAIEAMMSLRMGDLLRSREELQLTSGPRPGQDPTQRQGRAARIRWGAVPALAMFMALAALAPPAPGPCTCLTDSVCSGWCSACRVGWVASVQVRSRQLFEALDAHGHEIDPASFTCPTCRAALQHDGFCESCHWGFVGGLLYYSRLTYLLACGEPRERSDLECAECLKHSLCRSLPLEKDRWCQRCGIGMVGNVAFRDRREYDLASREFELLLRAIKESARCEDCAVAMFMGATCHKCGITYAGGVAQRVGAIP